ncbi:MAG: ATP synthase F1 subunit gamma [Oscillospiraceae bacterium]|nr:ATP synthase F1 subunit gamma [Oscillospiraceae bacterium]
MAGASMKDIKIRIKSVESTMQITKAMELVASSKLRHAKERVEKARPYFTTLHAALTDIAYSNTEFASPFIAKREVKKVCYVVIAGDRGLAGGYNSNIFKAVETAAGSAAYSVLPIGKKSVEYFERRKKDLVTKHYANVEDVNIGDCFEMGKILADGFLKGDFDELYLVYTNFVSMLSQVPATVKMLPVNYDEEYAKQSGPKNLIQYEPSSEAVFDNIVPQYIAGMIYGGLSESWASELGARRTAMDAASKNAGEMISDLSLKYNRARQASITQELTEIVSGAEAL